MIQDIFELTQSPRGTAEYQKETLDMKKLLEQTLGDMEDVIRTSGMVIREVMPEMPLKFTGDGKKMYRVLQNLIGNALKYSLKGTRIYIVAERKASQVCVTIKNTASYEMDFTASEIMERFASFLVRANSFSGNIMPSGVPSSLLPHRGQRSSTPVKSIRQEGQYLIAFSFCRLCARSSSFAPLSAFFGDAAGKLFEVSLGEFAIHLTRGLVHADHPFDP